MEQANCNEGHQFSKVIVSSTTGFQGPTIGKNTANHCIHRVGRGMEGNYENRLTS